MSLKKKNVSKRRILKWVNAKAVFIKERFYQRVSVVSSSYRLAWETGPADSNSDLEEVTGSPC